LDLYSLLVEEFTIVNTRSVITDTVVISESAHVDGGPVRFSWRLLGDLDNGTYTDPNPGELTDVVLNDPTSMVTFTFQLLNAGAGNMDGGALSARTAATADQLAGIITNLAPAAAAAAAAQGAVVNVAATVATWPFVVGLAAEAFATLYTWLTVDCDGPVAVDQVAGPRYLLDEWLDQNGQTLKFDRSYPGTNSPDGCGGNSLYKVKWSVNRRHSWLPVTDAAGNKYTSPVGLSAVEHNRAMHVFGGSYGRGWAHVSTYTGASWSTRYEEFLDLGLGVLPVTAVSFNDRLILFGVLTTGQIIAIAHTVDGWSWVAGDTNPPPFSTNAPVATAVFRNRLWLFAQDSAGAVHVTSTADVASWSAWAQVPAPWPSLSAVAAVALGETLYIFQVMDAFGKGLPRVMQSSSVDGIAWTAWTPVEGGAEPVGLQDSVPLDVSATTFRDRVYIATRWQTLDELSHVALNFTADGENWSGWRILDSDLDYHPSATVGLAPANNHLYITAPNPDDNVAIWAY